jgi:sugar-phosphatase
MASPRVRRFAGALFDLDGVLIDSTPAIVDLWRTLAADHGRFLSSMAVNRHVLGCAAEHTVSILFADLDVAARERILQRARTADPDLGFVDVPGGRELVRALAAAGVRLGLVTGASAHRARRATGGSSSPFAAMVTWGDTANGKPAPDCYQLGARRLGLRSAQCLVFEDAASGVQAARAAGSACIGIGSDPSLIEAGATWTVPDLTAVRVSAGAEDVELSLAGTVVARIAATAPVAAGPGRRA